RTFSSDTAEFVTENPPMHPEKSLKAVVRRQSPVASHHKNLLQYCFPRQPNNPCEPLTERCDEATRAPTAIKQAPPTANDQAPTTKDPRPTTNHNHSFIQ